MKSSAFRFTGVFLIGLHLLTIAGCSSATVGGNRQIAALTGEAGGLSEQALGFIRQDIENRRNVIDVKDAQIAELRKALTHVEWETADRAVFSVAAGVLGTTILTLGFLTTSNMGNVVRLLSTGVGGSIDATALVTLKLSAQEYSQANGRLEEAKQELERQRGELDLLQSSLVNISAYSGKLLAQMLVLQEQRLAQAQGKFTEVRQSLNAADARVQTAYSYRLTGYAVATLAAVGSIAMGAYFARTTSANWLSGGILSVVLAPMAATTALGTVIAVKLTVEERDALEAKLRDAQDAVELQSQKVARLRAALAG